ncbi:ABC transporter substrate-binding protein [Kineosporia sp. J2-2]|uniref:ABC transporter substrate-binding protein n=1 Tax=Kineosporia corallincola TaxID=2835133 RepID=A0ABS5TT26_9ACTN|nr:ABC transporter substrate-binding protein [Kineosporia corallincola]MBT0773974.1 ABC transporter substrate-binding protein [Kineosporia corallincola]
MLRRSSLRLAGAAATLALLTTACGSGDGDDGDAGDGAQQGSRQVSTTLGTVEVPETIDSVVVLEGRRDQDLVLSLGLPLTGIPQIDPEAGYELENPLAAATQASGAKELFLEGEINLEAIAATGPDLIVSRASDVEGIQSELEAVAPVLAVGEQTTSTWQDDLTLLGEATGTQDKAAQLIADYDARVAQIKQKYADEIADTTIAPIVYNLEGTGIRAQRLQSQVLRDIGATPSEAFADAIADADTEVEFSPEQTLQAYQDADAMLVAVNTADEWQAAQNDQLFQQLPAVENDRIVRTDKFSFEGGPITAMHVLDVVEQLYAS